MRNVLCISRSYILFPRGGGMIITGLEALHFVKAWMVLDVCYTSMPPTEGVRGPTRFVALARGLPAGLWTLFA